MIRPVPGGFVVVTSKSTSKVYRSRKGAEKRLAEIEMFKHMGMNSRKKK